MKDLIKGWNKRLVNFDIRIQKLSSIKKTLRGDERVLITENDTYADYYTPGELREKIEGLINCRKLLSEFIRDIEEHEKETTN